MNVLTRRCGCGTVFALVHLRDRSQQCKACQRKQAASMDKGLAHRYLKALERVLRAKAKPAVLRFCEGD